MPQTSYPFWASIENPSQVLIKESALKPPVNKLGTLGSAILSPRPHDSPSLKQSLEKLVLLGGVIHGFQVVLAPTLSQFPDLELVLHSWTEQVPQKVICDPSCKAHGGTPGAVLCRTRRWTLMILVCSFQHR